MINDKVNLKLFLQKDGNYKDPFLQGYDADMKVKQTKKGDDYFELVFKKNKESELINLFKNNFKQRDVQPDFTTPKDSKLKGACWLKQSKNGNAYYSIQLSPQIDNDFIKEKVERDKSYDPISQKLKDDFGAEEMPF